MTDLSRHETLTGANQIENEVSDWVIEHSPGTKTYPAKVQTSYGRTDREFFACIETYLMASLPRKSTVFQLARP